MKLLTLLLLCLVHLDAQPQKKVRQLLALVLNEEPDRLGNTNKYLLLADQPEGVMLQPKQTFVLRSAWQKEGDSVMNTGSGIFRKSDGYTTTLDATLLPGKTVQKADVAMFLVPLNNAGKDSVILNWPGLLLALLLLAIVVFLIEIRFCKNQQLIQLPV